MSVRTASASRGVPKLRYGIALILGFGALINYFDRVNLSVASRALDQQFGIGAIGFGVLSSAYSYTYAALQIPVGLALDRYGVATLGRIGALIWSLASFWSGLSGSFASFLGSRLLLGVGEAPTFPGNAKASPPGFPVRNVASRPRSSIRLQSSELASLRSSIFYSASFLEDIHEAR